MLETESQARAYSATHDGEDLEAYFVSRQAVLLEISRLYEQARPEPLLAAELPELDRLARAVLDGSDLRLRGIGGSARSPSAAQSIEKFSIAQKRFADVAFDLRSQRLGGLNRLWDASIAVLTLGAVCGVIATITLGVVARRQLARRIERVEQRARLYTSGSDAPDPPPVDGDDEIASLDDALRTMATTIAKREAELRLALSEAEAASRSKSAFVATVSHELRTPLNGVIGISELLMEAALPAPQREYVATIHSSSELLLGIINDILDFSKLNAGELSLIPAEVKLDSVTHAAAALFSAQAQEKGLALKVHFGAGVPASVLADELRLRQVLANVIGNAVKFTPAGSVSISVTSQNQSAGRSLVTFEIADTGVG
ncbi:MAG TPA: histidine kinase dimerization/phospho-acceptor domain-containing protein, partial [Gemmatimonadaceae bacterium]|nr:histidine kinase dimerization/phospho-acceptor domain-containing protein [Gemmatimonadaceae bacterium]